MTNNALQGCRRWVLNALLMLALLLLTGCQPGPASRHTSSVSRPNVILLITDDQGIGDFGVMGNTVIETPNLDALARSSASVSDFYVSPVCSPTRASLMTGRYHMRTQCVDTFKGRSRMSADEVTLAEVLRGAGYATGIFGKWHLGDNHPMRPSDQGFDESLIHLGGGIGQPSDPRNAMGQYTDPVLYRKNREVQTRGYCTDVYTDAAIRFIRAKADAGKPFFAYVATNAPHGPFHDVPEALRLHYAEKDLSPIMSPGDRGKPAPTDRLERIAAMIGNIDQNVGRLMRSLEADGLLDNTIVVYLNDNGPNSRRFVGAMRGMKTEIYEGGIRSPLWVRWDGVLEPGHEAELVAAHIDLMPTLLAACGVEQPAGIKLDGTNILPQLTGASAEQPNRSIVIQAHRGTAPSRYNNFMIRRGDWKLLNATRPWGKEIENNATFELYNLADDPGETSNLAEKHPERFETMRQAYDAWFEDVSASFAKRPFPVPIVIDPLQENPALLTGQDRDAEGWLLQIDRAGRYDVRFELRQPTGQQAGRAMLEIGAQTLNQQVPAGSDTVLFEAVLLEPGPTRLSATIESEGGRRKTAPYHVRVIGR